LNRSHGYDYPQDYDFWVGYIVGGIFVLLAALLYLDTITFLVKAKSVQGTVIELNDSPGRHFLKVVFREETTKRRFEFISLLSFSLTDYNEDERVTVFYDSENPENAKIGDFIDLFVVPTFFFLMGAFSCLLGFLQIRSRPKIKRKEEM
jgi:hypothetical protein